MFEFVGQILSVGGIICGGIALSFLFLSFAINTTNEKSSFVKVLLRIISFLVFCLIGSVAAWAIGDSFFGILFLISYVVGAFLSIYSKKKIKEQEAKKQEQPDDE